MLGSGGVVVLDRILLKDLVDTAAAERVAALGDDPSRIAFDER